MAKYVQRYDGEGWAVKSGEIARIRCCHCRLVHKIVLTVGKGKEKNLIGIAVEVDNRATAASRRSEDAKQRIKELL